jgi:maltose alpha-D-glucosyltransferase/alpha-amylase
MDMLGDYCERVLALPEAPAAPPQEAWPTAAAAEMPQLVDDLLGDYLDHIAILGRRLGELHLLLASDRKLPAFAPESYAALHHRSIYQSMRTLKMGVFDELRRRRENLSPKLRMLAQQVLGCDADIMRRFRQFLEQKLSVMRIRCHGDFHLSNVLWTGKDFIIANFQGAPAGSSASERRLKRCAVWDVASMLRSFHYATHFALFSHGKDAPNSQVLVRKADRERLQPWVEFWNRWVSHEFLAKYRQTVEGANLLPGDEAAFETVLDAFMLERALRELRHEFRFRNRRTGIPLAGILDILRIAPPSPAPVEQPSEVASAGAGG